MLVWSFSQYVLSVSKSESIVKMGPATPTSYTDKGVHEDLDTKLLKTLINGLVNRY